MQQNMSVVINDWQTKNKCFSERCSYMLDKKILTDCEFHVGNEKVLCHKLILAMASPVFQAMFFRGYTEGTGPVVITDIKLDIFLQMIQFIYDVKLNIESYTQACELYYAAKKYLLIFLEKECIDYLSSNLNHSNAIYLYEFSKFHDVTKLRKQCVLEIQLHTAEVLKSKHASSMSEETLSSILDHNILNVSTEVTLYKVVEEWTLSRLTTKDSSSTQWRSKINGLIKKIRFLTLTPNEFASDIADSTLLTDKEKLDILLRVTKSIDTKMDNGLCELKQKRRPVNIKSTTVLNIKDVSEARCDGSEWLTSLFKVTSPMELIGAEVRMQINPKEGEYIENVMVTVAEAQSKFHFAEGNLCGFVQYNSKAQILFNTVAKLTPGKEYALHVFLCRPGMYPIGRHYKLACENNEPAVVDFISHSSWQGAHPFNTTVLASIIYTDTLGDDDAIQETYVSSSIPELLL